MANLATQNEACKTFKICSD